MSEYWKSVPRKFCEFCKCWITDNKPSVDFHERGKRHQENVELRLKEVRKKGLQQSREDEQLKSQMDKMEQAALEAFKKDLKDNPQLASQYGVSLEPKPNTDNTASEVTSPTPSTNTEDNEKKKKKRKKKKKEWYEAVSPEGYHYYWSTVTGESKWEAPDDYMSLAEQNGEETEEGEKSKEGNAETSNKVEEKIKTLETPKMVLHSKKSKTGSTDTVVKDGVNDTLSTAQPVIPTQTKTQTSSAFGGWEVVNEVERPQMFDESSTAPALDDIPLPVPGEDKPTEPEIKKAKVIKEKVVTLGPSKGGPVAFKKRKIGGGRNVRQKGDDD